MIVLSIGDRLKPGATVIIHSGEEERFMKVVRCDIF